MHHHKHDKSQNDIKHFARMIANIEKALETNQNLDKFVIEEKISENIEVKDHVKAHNRIIDKFKKIKHHIKKQAEHALLEFIKYGFDRTPENVWKNIMESKLKQLHPHHHEKDLREVITTIKSGTELSFSIRNAFKNIKDSQIIAATLKLNDKIECMEKFLNGLTCFPIKNDKLQGMENILGAATKNQLLYVRSVFQTITEQFQKLKPFAQNHMTNTFTAVLSQKLVIPIDYLLKKDKEKELDVGDEAARWKDLKVITENLANNQFEKINENYQRLNQALVEDLKNIKAEMLTSNKISFDIYKKMVDASSKFIKKVKDPKKAKDRSSVLLADLLRQIDPFLSFCNKISSLQIIKEKLKASKYTSMQSNHSFLEIYFQILRDNQFDRDCDHDQNNHKPNDNSSSELKKLLDFNTQIYNILILKKSGGCDPVSFEKIQYESKRILSEIKRLIFETQKKDRNTQPQKNELQSQQKDKEIQKLHKQMQVMLQLLQQQVQQNQQDVKLFNEKLQKQINESLKHMKKVRELKEQLHNSQRRCFLLQEEIQTQKELVRQRQDTINKLENKLQKFMQQNQGHNNENHSIEERDEQHKALLVFAQHLYDELMKRFQMVPYFDKYIKHPKPINVKQSINQLNKKLEFLFRLLECYITFAKKSKLWETNAVMLEITASKQEKFNQKCLQMWKSDLQQCVKTFTNRGAYMHEYQDSVINEF